jgi:hypothetical protein
MSFNDGNMGIMVEEKERHLLLIDSLIDFE